MKCKQLAVLVASCSLGAACFSLDVSAVQPVDGTNYTRDSVLSDPGILELAVASSFIAYWSAINTERPNVALSVLGEEMTSSVITYSSALFTHISEPREAFDNSLTGGNRIGRDPWGFLYESNSHVSELSGHVVRTGMRIVDVNGVDNTARLLAWSRWQMGLAHISIGMLFDSGAVVNRETDITKPLILPLRGYREVLDSGIKWLEEAIELATETPFLVPFNDNIWIYGTQVSSETLIEVAHGYIARALAYGARTPSEPVDWARVKFHAERGVKQPFGPKGNSANSFINYLYKRAVTSAPQDINAICSLDGTNVCGGGTAGYFRVDYRLLGPADSSGAYQTWLTQAADPANFTKARPFNILTSDARIQEPNGLDPNQSAPVYFKHSGGIASALWPPQNRMDTTARGTYYVSFYWNSTRARDNRTQWPATGGGRSRDNANDLRFQIDDMMNPAEMQLLVAEASLKLGDLATARDIINETRVNNGDLPPVTTTGVPVANNCVPKRYDGACGDLMDALQYEKRIETFGTGISYYDLRRWGCLIEGTWTQLPVPGQQLDLMGKTVYTYGGRPGEVGSAAKPNNCPIMHRPS